MLTKEVLDKKIVKIFFWQINLLNGNEQFKNHYSIL